MRESKGNVEICEDMECVILNETGYAITEQIINQKNATHIRLFTENDAWVDGGEKHFLLEHYDGRNRGKCEF